HGSQDSLVSDLYPIHSDLIQEGEEFARFMGLGTTLPKKSTITFLHLPFYSTKRERNLIISHSSQLVLAGKTDCQYPRKEIQSPSAKPRAITNTPQNTHFTCFFRPTFSSVLAQRGS